MNNIMTQFMNEGMSKAEAENEYRTLREDFYEALATGSMYEAEDILYEYGIDLDDVFDLI